MRFLSLLVSCGLLLAAPSALAQDVLQGALIQPPKLAAPEKGSIAGTFSALAFGPGDLARGTYRLRLPIDAPEERGPLLAGVFPSYAPDGGLSEWGHGFNVDLAIRRTALIGDIHYSRLEFASPWGPIEQGSDGFFYPRGLAAAVRLELRDQAWIAWDSEGTEYHFAAVDAITTPGGTYAWMLSEVRSILGDVTTLHWTKNDSGRAFLDGVDYGGRPTPEYQIVLEYEPLEQAFQDRRAGVVHALDRRVKTVRFLVRTGAGGTFEERYHYALRYDPASTGPTFYLRNLEKTYASGEREPAVVFNYHDAMDRLLAASPVVVPSLTSYLRSTGPNGLEPGIVASIDVDEDGRLDFEHHRDHRLARQTDAGWVIEPLPPTDALRDPRCRPNPSGSNDVRVLQRLHPKRSVQVVRIYQGRSSSASTTTLLLCDRAGHVQHEGEIPGEWSLEDRATRLTDLNHDGRPDLIRMSDDRFFVLENASTETETQFIEHGMGIIRGTPPRGAPIWLEDLTGDAIPDLVTLDGSGMRMWPGKGNFQFEPDGVFLLFYGFLASPETSSRVVLVPIQGMDTVFFDANGDGLRDVLLIHHAQVELYTNRGDRFQQVHVPALRAPNARMGFPIPVNASGSGNVELTYVEDDQAMALELEQAGTGLLGAVDDGKGTVVSFRYDRSRAVPGLGHRPVVLSAVTRASSGAAAVEVVYDYESPALHSRTPLFLGFGEVSSFQSSSETTTHFRHDDVVQDLVLGTTSRDSRLSVERFVDTDYEPAESFGLTWARRKSERSGWRTLDGTKEVAKNLSVVSYEREICPTVTELDTGHGILRTTTRLASLPAFTRALHCMTGGLNLVGRHDDPTLDFEVGRTIDRNRFGQPERILANGPDGDRLMQEAGYDSLNRLVRIGSPGKGTTTIRYEGTTGLLKRMEAPDGVIKTVTERDPRTASIRGFRVDYGDRIRYQGTYRFDGQERLSHFWDNSGLSSEANPLETLTYAFATVEQPGLIQRKRLVGRQILEGTPTQVYERVGEIFSGDGAAITSALKIPEGWALGDLSRSDPARFEETSWRQGVLALDELGELTYEALFAGARELGRAESSVFGSVLASTEVVQTGVTRATSRTMAIEDGALVETAKENGAHPRRVAQDADGRLLWSLDPDGHRTSMTYDALGELVAVQLPDGKRHEVRYDAYRRVSAVHRDGLVHISYHYDPVTSLPTEKRVSRVDGTLEHRVSWTRDAIGRTTIETHFQASTGLSRSFHFEYDGALSDQTHVPGQKGKVSRIYGDGFEKRMRYDTEERIRESRIQFPGWRTVVEAQEYHANGKVRLHRTEVRGPSDELIQALDEEFLYDAWGRLASYLVNGAKVYDLHYDAKGDVEQAAFPDGRSVNIGYDELTREPSGFWHDGGTWNAGVEIRLNTRGLVESETYAFGSEYWERRYGYDARGFLAEAIDRASTSRYTYDAVGLLSSIEDLAGARTVSRRRDLVSAGAVFYDVDGLGRIARRRAGEETTELVYGPTGEIDQARTGDREISFFYDEGGNRVLKREGDRFLAAYIEDAFLDEQRLVVPVRIADRLIGYLENGRFEMVATDPRGTVIGEGQAPIWSTPYGARAERPAIAEAMEFVEKGYDADLGLVRMGARDYDPYLGQFMAPDPLLVEDLDRCAQRPAECNLFGYAANNPVSFVDPTGTSAWSRLTSIANNFADHAGDFAVGFVGGAVKGAAVSVVLGAGLAVLSAPVAATVAVAAGAYAVYQIAAHANDLKSMAERVGSGQGTSDDWELIGDFVGGTVGGGAGARVGARVGAKLRPVAQVGCRTGGCGIQGGNCFAAGTLVATATGPVPIEAITPGTLVWARDAETGAIGLKPVGRHFVREAAGLLVLELERDDGVRTTIETTPEHPFWVEDRGWLRAGELRVGDPVMDLAGGSLRVGSATWVEGRATVYNFEVQDHHTYAVGDLEAWVHNSYKPKPPKDAPKKYPHDRSTPDTINRSGYYRSEREARSVARTKIGRNPVQIEPGKLRSRDGRWQYRGKAEDLLGHSKRDTPHIHIERLDPETGSVLENWHLRWSP